MSNPISPASDSIKNYILKSLPEEDLERLRTHLVPVDLPRGEIIFEADGAIADVYFPNDSMISVVATTASGQSAEAGVIGSEGFGGTEALLGNPKSLNELIIQLPGTGYRAPVDAVIEEFQRAGAFQKAALEFIRAMMSQMSQTTLCNRLHIAEQRLAKWLLMCHDRSPSDVLPLTHEFTALMLGSNRVSVTQSAIRLQEQGFIKYSRGRISIVDRKGLESYACECYSRIRNQYKYLES